MSIVFDTTDETSNGGMSMCIGDCDDTNVWFQEKNRTLYLVIGCLLIFFVGNRLHKRFKALKSLSKLVTEEYMFASLFGFGLFLLYYSL